MKSDQWRIVAAMNRSDIDLLFVILFAFTALTFALLYRWVGLRDGGSRGVDGGAGGADGSGSCERGGGTATDRRFYVLAAVALLVRLAFSASIEGFPSDIACFKSWSQAAAGDFFSLYDRGPDFFIDYPPGYMYILLVLGKIRELFAIPADSGLYTSLIKLPPMLADVATGVIVYRLTGTASGQASPFSGRARLLLASLTLFNPVMLFISTVWGQVDSFVALLTLAAILLLTRGRPYAAGACYAFMVLQKPQGIIFLPVVFFWLLFNLLARRDWRTPAKLAAAAVVTAAALILPFELRHGPLWIVELYTKTLSGYQYATMNAFNLFALFGGNWADDSQKLLSVSFAHWGMLAIVLSTLLSGLFVFLMKSREGVSDAYILCMGSALLLFGVVTFGHRMHERYFAPVLPLLIAASVLRARDCGGEYRRNLDTFMLPFASVSVSGFLNVLFVFSAFYVYESTDFYDSAWIYVISLLNVAAALYLWGLAFRQAGKGEPPRKLAGRLRAALTLLAALCVALCRPAGGGSVYAADAASVANAANAAYAANAAVGVAADTAGEPVALQNPGFEDGGGQNGAAASGTDASDAGTSDEGSSDGGGQTSAEGVPGWSLYDYRGQYDGAPDTSRVALDAEHARAGAYSVRVESASANDVRLYQTIPVSQDSLYRMSCYIKTDSVADIGVGANISVMGVFAVSGDVTGTSGDFRLVELYGRTGPGQTLLDVAIGIGGYSSECYGIAWFDDVVVERLDAVPQGTVILDLFDAGGADGGNGGDAAGGADGNGQSAPNAAPAWAIFTLLLAALAVLAVITVLALGRPRPAPGFTPGSRFTRDDVTAMPSASPDDVTTSAASDGVMPLARRLDRRDAMIMGILTAVYLAVALIRLGGFVAPQTHWKPGVADESVVFDFGGPVELTKLMYNCNAIYYEDTGSAYELYALVDTAADATAAADAADATGGVTDGVTDVVTDNAANSVKENSTETRLGGIGDGAFYEWMELPLRASGVRAVRLAAVEYGLMLNEIAFFGVGADGREGLLPVTVAEGGNAMSADAVGHIRNLVDEQDTVPERPDILNSTYFDEVYFPRTAYEHIHNMPVYETTHPPLGKLLTALGILIFGMNPFGWRIMGTLAGAAMLPAMYAFGKKLFAGRFYAFCCAFLMMFDFMHFAQTRLSTIDSYATLAIILMYMFMLDSFMNGIAGRPLRDALVPLAFAGLAFGLGASVKWIVLYGGVGIAYLFAAGRARELLAVFGFGARTSKTPSKTPSRPIARRAAGAKSARLAVGKAGVGIARGGAVGDTRRSYLPRLYIVLGACVVFFVLIPGVVYLLSYIPYTNVAGAGAGSASGQSGGLFGIMLENQKAMFDYHGSLTDTHPFSSAWWSWPLNLKPIWYYSASGLDAARKAGVASFGNPLIWWTGVPCLIAALVLAARRGERRMAVVFAGFLFQYGPWMFISRVTFIYHYFSALPFVIFAIVYVIKTLIDERVIGRAAVYVYLAAAAALFVVYYPVLSGLPVSGGYSDGLRLFSTWIW